ncbi:MAG: hypothetical protein ABIT20_14435 [Gemmatimonadaceae bacterium]
MSDDGKTISDLPAKGQKPPKNADEKVPSSLAGKDADTVKGGAGPKIPVPGLRTNHNQTLLARRGSVS